jgi:triacylglycerol esterase/lipase EstA (alpha/beta hydrolase family)
MRQVNLIGYSVGVLGVWYIVKKFLSEEGMMTMCVAFAYMMIGASIMLFLRRKGLCAP